MISIFITLQNLCFGITTQYYLELESDSALFSTVTASARNKRVGHAVTVTICSGVVAFKVGNSKSDMRLPSASRSPVTEPDGELRTIICASE